MAKKLRKEEWAVEKSIEAALELMGWQAELLRGALRKVRKEASSPTSQKRGVRKRTETYLKPSPSDTTNGPTHKK